MAYGARSLTSVGRGLGGFFMGMQRCAPALAAGLSLGACASDAGLKPEPVPAPVAETAVPAAPQFTRDQLAGADPDDLELLFDAPGLVRREGAGEFRRYGLANCSLIVILYPDETGDMRVDHIEAAALSSEDEKPDLDACLARGF